MDNYYPWIIFVLYVIFVAVFAQPPPPPEVPKQLLSSLLLDTSASTTNQNQMVVNGSGSDVAEISMCLDIVCNLEFIPEECQTAPILDINGAKCRGCPIWKDSCKAGLDTITIQCPQQACENIFIPQHCIEISTYNYEGLVCKRCPKWRDGCKMETVVPNNPIVRPPAVACPLLACDTFVPAECQVINKYEFRGQMCQRCPIWQEGCRESERLNSLANPFNAVPQPILPCPRYPCSDIVIPEECKEEQPFDFNGKTCYKCPKWKTGCQPPSVLSNSNAPIIACPLMKCDIPNVPKQCLQEETFLQQGRTCHKCPSVIPGCVDAFLHPQTNPNQHLVKSVDINPEDACPLVRCRLVYIPEECLEVETFQFKGMTCKGCPRHRTGCEAPKLTQPTESNPTVSRVPQIPPSGPQIENIANNQPEKSCPLLACTTLLIPPECVEEQTFTLNGKLCYNCPKWRAGCVANNINAQAELACPLVPCPRIHIPTECREEQPYDFRGKTCYRCPKWKEGCIPSAVPQSGQTSPLDPDPADSTNAVLVGEVSCPLYPCSKIRIPKECEELTPYQHQGKTCYKCPIWRTACQPGETIDQSKTNSGPEVACPMLICDSTSIPTECQEQKTMQIRGKTCQACPIWKDGCVPSAMNSIEKQPTAVGNNVIKNLNNIDSNNNNYNNTNAAGSNFKISTLPQILPVDSLRQMIAAAVCPPLPCPNLNIPIQCRESTTYRYKSVTCEGCPRLSITCMYGAFGSSGNNANINGLMAFNMFNEMFLRRR